MLKIYDQYKNIVGYIKAYTDLCVESELESGDKTLTFTYRAKKAKNIQNEYYVETQDDWYVVKEIGVSSDGFPEYTCQLDLEDLEAEMVESFSAENVTCEAAANLALAGTGWLVDTDITKLRSVATLKAIPLTILGKIRDAFMREILYDTKNKVIFFREEFGEDKGVFFTRSLNLRKVKMTADTYDYYTRIVPIGADDLRIDDVNDGLGYVENYQYSDKVRTLIWEDTSYDDADALLEDATAKLEDLSKPKKSYSAEVVDLAKQKTQYGIMDFGLVDTILLLDEETGIKDKQRIVKLKEYPDNPWKNSCELSNTTLTWEELQSKLEAAANAFEEITNSDGTINGYYVYGVSSDGVVVITTSTGDDRTTTTTTSILSSVLSSLNSNISAVSATVGTLNATVADITKLTSTYATIENLDAANAKITNLDTKYANITNAIIGEAAIEKLIAGEAEIEIADIGGLMAKYAQIDLANVTTESVGNLFAEVGALEDITIVDGQVTGTLSGVTIYGDCIVANSIVADALVLKGADGLYYAINASSDTLTSEQLTDEKYQKYLDGSVIVAESITGTKIAATMITADKIDVIDLFAQDITATGTITGLILKGGSINIGDDVFTVDSSGNMVAKSGTFYGKLSGVTGTFSGELDAASGSFTGDVHATSFSLNDTTISTKTITPSTQSGIMTDTDSYTVLYFDTDGGVVCDGYFEASEIHMTKIVNGDGWSAYLPSISETSNLVTSTYGSAVGSSTTSVYINSSGIATACEYSLGNYLPLSGGTLTGAVTFAKTVTCASGYISFSGAGGGHIDNQTAQQLILAASSESEYPICLGVADSMWGLHPVTSGYVNLGTPTYKWGSIYCGSGGTVCTHTAGTAVGSAYIPVYISTSGVAIACQIYYLCQAGTSTAGAVCDTDGFRVSMAAGSGGLTLGTSTYKWGNIYATSSAIQTSDERVKTNITDIDETYEKLFMKLRGVNYKYKNFTDEDNHGRIHCGLIAQEVETALMEVGLTSTEFATLCYDELEAGCRPDGRTDEYAIAYSELHGIEVHMIQKSLKAIDELKSQIATLQNQLAELQASA